MRNDVKSLFSDIFWRLDKLEVELAYQMEYQQYYFRNAVQKDVQTISNKLDEAEKVFTRQCLEKARQNALVFEKKVANDY
ncbi:hypothetical protein EJF36_11120 [Bacillus sp. HMF5848]|uniref:hypothetical protein n=1 Tax=Bacillus sp. HMF5848 TaxID=2495421 RepID=UPI000F79457C|nr:hypothetical protein [Bacillus sp. HMF5848]RSK27390.1 hypothetical protein EJF36_11120 [Bacillus sp. HMF5848]